MTVKMVEKSQIDDSGNSTGVVELLFTVNNIDCSIQIPDEKLLPMARILLNRLSKISGAKYLATPVFNKSVVNYEV